MTVMVFDIETIPNINLIKSVNPNLAKLSDQDCLLAYNHQRAQEQSINYGTNYPSDFVPLHFHQVVAISVLVRQENSFKLWSLGNEDSDEKDIVSRFFAGIDKYTPTLISWNGTGFDLPVLNYAALRHKVQSAKYWDTGTLDSQFKWNNYLNRYHSRHLDLMDLLAMHQQRANAPLDQVASFLGLPGKMGIDGSKVYSMYLSGKISEIRDYCETDVLNTYLVFLHFERIRSHLSEERLENELLAVKDFLAKENKNHLDEFLDKWNNKKNEPTAEHQD